MGLNTNISLLDTGQLVKRVFDSDNDSVRITLAEATGIAIELSAADGDNIDVKGLSTSTKASLTSASTGTIVAATDCNGIKSFQLYTNTTSTIVGAQVCTVQISPSDTDDVWIDTALTVTPSDTLSVVVMGTALTNIVARRVRVKIAAAITSGTFDIYLVRQGV